MALMRTKWVTASFTPASYTADETTAVLQVSAGDMIEHVSIQTVVAFNGSGTDAIVALGDGVDPDRYIKAGDVTEQTAGFYPGTGGSGSDYLLIGEHVYTVDDNIDLVFTANTSGGRTAGEFKVFAAKTNVFRP